MNEPHDRFEDDLRADLTRLAAEGPAAPHADRVLRRLRRRTVRRAVFAATGAVVLAAAVLTTAPLLYPPAPEGGTGSGAPPVVVARENAVEPLPPTTDSRQVEATLARYLASAGAPDSMLVTKSPADGVSFVVPGRTAFSTQVMSRDLETIFQNFEQVNVSMRGGKAAMVLLRAERSQG